MKDQLALPSPTPWYRTRWFWGVFLFFALLLNLVFFFSLFYSASSSFEIFRAFVSVGGAATFIGMAYTILGYSELALTLGVITFLLFVLFSLTETFRKKPVNVVYPLLLVTNLALNAYILQFSLSGL